MFSRCKRHIYAYTHHKYTITDSYASTAFGKARPSTCFADASPMRKRITHVQSHTLTQTQKTRLRSLHLGAFQPPTHITNIRSQTHKQTHRRRAWSLQMLARILIMRTHIILHAYMHRTHLHIRNTTACGGPHVLCSHLIYAPTTSNIYNPKTTCKHKKHALKACTWVLRRRLIPDAYTHSRTSNHKCIRKHNFENVS
jgi:hypothetical protein